VIPDVLPICHTQTGGGGGGSFANIGRPGILPDLSRTQEEAGMPSSSRTLFIISDRTGITLENLVRTLVTQFDDLCCERMVLPFLDTPAKIEAAIREIDAIAAADKSIPVVFSSIVDEAMRARLKEAKAQVFDIFDTYLPALSTAIGIPHSGHVGRSHGRHG
jgi:regulator of PEP synthase PpsR (kinase-PPPase family)